MERPKPPTHAYGHRGGVGAHPYPPLEAPDQMFLHNWKIGGNPWQHFDRQVQYTHQPSVGRQHWDSFQDPNATHGLDQRRGGAGEFCSQPLQSTTTRAPPLVHFDHQGLPVPMLDFTRGEGAHSLSPPTPPRTQASFTSNNLHESLPSREVGTARWRGIESGVAPGHRPRRPRSFWNMSARTLQRPCKVR